jgi:hypothetical protein
MQSVTKEVNCPRIKARVVGLVPTQPNGGTVFVLGPNSDERTIPAQAN